MEQNSGYGAHIGDTAMPFGVRKIESFRTLTTESLAVFIPFRVQDCQK